VRDGHDRRGYADARRVHADVTHVQRLEARRSLAAGAHVTNAGGLELTGNLGPEAAVGSDVRDDACNQTHPSPNVTGNRSNETASPADSRAADDIMTPPSRSNATTPAAKPCHRVSRPSRSSPEPSRRPRRAWRAKSGPPLSSALAPQFRRKPWLALTPKRLDPTRVTRSSATMPRSTTPAPRFRDWKRQSPALVSRSVHLPSHSRSPATRFVQRGTEDRTLEPHDTDLDDGNRRRLPRPRWRLPRPGQHPDPPGRKLRRRPVAASRALERDLH
jgi:hypothetical protein